MGGCVSKCYPKADKKYKKAVIRTRPDQDDTDVNIATNSGAMLVKSQETDKHADNRHSKIARNDEKKDKKAVNDDKKNGNKTTDRTNRQRKSRESDEGTDSSSSSSSDSSVSSDSDSDDNKYTKRSRRMHKNRGGGGTTIISKHTIIGGNKYSYGKNCQNMTINHARKSSPKSKQTDNRKQTELLKPVFKSYYSESEAKEEEKRQFTSPWGQNTTPPMGNFIDTRGMHFCEYVFESSVRIDASEWVCKICFPGGSATGFRVGRKYIMTANHVVKQILDGGYAQVGNLAQNPFTQLQNDGVFAVFNYTTDGQISDRQKFFFKDVVHFHDDETDTAVLELEDNQTGTPMPLSFTFFSLPQMNSSFSFIGHSEGKRKQINHVDRIIDINNTAIQTGIGNIRQLSQQYANRDYEFAPHSMITNPHRYLFHCKFSKGASGSPGVVVLEDGRVVVVTMLLRGFPDWYYDSSVADGLKTNWPKEHCVEQGVNLKSVYERMANKNLSLCSEIFSDHTHTIPNPIR